MTPVLKRTLTLPNLLSILRLLLGPVLLGMGWTGAAEVFIGVLILAFFLDLIDGPIARRFGLVSELGPKLDSLADFSVYVLGLIGAWWLWPELFRRELVYFILLALGILLPALIGLLKFHRPTSYHTWLVKTAVVCMAPSIIILFIGGPAWPFRIAAVLSALAGAEEIIITLLSREPRSDVRHVFAIMKQGRDGKQG